MVDEAQDLTPIMTRLLIEYYKFTKRNGIDVAFTIVGDRKQAIYAFANRIDAFEVIERELGKDKVQYFTLNESYRMSPSVCNFTNNLCKKLGIYKEREKIIPALPEKRGTVFNEYLNLENVCEYALKENEKLLILGRTNAEILVKYLELYFYFKNAAPQELKYIKLDSKIKSQFKKLLKNGFENGIDDTLKEKLMLLTGKEKFTINDLKDESIMEKLPLFLQKYIELSNKFTDEEMLEALNLRSSPKALIQLMTLHSSKGLEAENVYVLDGILETIDLNNKNGKTLKEKLEVKLKIKEQSEELRLIEAEKFLLYVGVTRAKRNLFLDKELLNAFKKAIQNVNNKEIEQKIKDFLLEKVIDKTIISTNDDPTVKTKTKLKK
jgi:ATP-dependent exoDNAse (exonuclease V) beta subunit